MLGWIAYSGVRIAGIAVRREARPVVELPVVAAAALTLSRLADLTEAAEI